MHIIYSYKGDYTCIENLTGLNFHLNLHLNKPDKKLNEWKYQVKFTK